MRLFSQLSRILTQNPTNPSSVLLRFFDGFFKGFLPIVPTPMLIVPTPMLVQQEAVLWSIPSHRSSSFQSQQSSHDGSSGAPSFSSQIRWSKTFLYWFTLISRKQKSVEYEPFHPANKGPPCIHCVVVGKLPLAIYSLHSPSTKELIWSS